MKPRYITPIASLLLGSACVPAPPPLPVPASEAVFVRVNYQTGCPGGARCVGVWPAEPIDGLVAWLDPDILVLYDSWAAPQVTIPVAHITKLEICRGQEEACAQIATTERDYASALVFGIALGASAAAVASTASWAVQPAFAEAAAEGAAASVAISADANTEADAATGDLLWEAVTFEQLLEEFRLKRKPMEELAEPA